MKNASGYSHSLRSLFALPVFALATGGFACSSSSNAPGAHDAGVTADTGDEAPPPCNALAVAAPLVNYSLSSLGGPPADMGGTIADGTYYLTGYTIYAGGSVGAGYVAEQQTSVTLVVAGSSWTQVQVFQIENTTDTVATNYTASAIGSSITLTPTCPVGPAVIASYTATGTAIELDTVNDFPISETLAKQ